MPSSINPYTFFDEFVLRIAAFPFDRYVGLATKQHIQKRDLLSIWDHATYKEALFLASPNFYSISQNYIDDETLQDCNSVGFTLIKYIARMCSRATPFGLFAGITTGTIADNTSIALDRSTAYKRSSRLDMSFIFALSQEFSKKDGLQRQLRFFPNSSVYKIADHYRYIEYVVKDTERLYSLEGIESTVHLDKILFQAREGKTIAKLSQSLVDENISFEEACQYIQTLIEHQVLVSELELQLTGEDNLSTLINHLSKFENTSSFLKPLQAIKQRLAQLDQKIGNLECDYTSLYELLDKTGVIYKKQHSIQSDLFVECTSLTLAKKHAHAVQNALTVLNKLSPFIEHKNLAAFKKAFWERYEGREVPLTTVLDIESGIGYGQGQSQMGITPFLEDIKLPIHLQRKKEEISIHPITNFLEQKLLKAIHTQKYTLELVDEELEDFSCSWEDLPDSFSAMIEIIGEENKEQLILKSVGGTSAANLHARFCHGSKNTEKHVQRITDAEEQLQSDKILAEIIHLPEARTGNVLKHPVLRKYEIPYLGKSAVAVENQISVDDLVISIRNNKIVLHSKRLNKEVIPKLTNAHNYSRKALPIYHFLCDLQKQQLRTAIGFKWPKRVENHPFLPRVVYKNCILSKAQWQLNKEDISAFLALYEETEQLMERIDQWRKRYQVPNWVEWVEFDNTLPIHLENSTLVRLWLSSIKNKDKCRLQEFLLPQSSLVKRDGAFFGHEIVLSFYKNIDK